MGLTLFLAQLFGSTFLIISIAMAFKRKEMLQIIEDFLKSRGTLFLAAIISLFAGILLVLVHNDWSGDLTTLLITLLGWGLTLRGIVWLFLPAGALRKLFRSVKKEQTYYIVVLIVFILGAYLAYAGFAA